MNSQSPQPQPYKALWVSDQTPLSLQGETREGVPWGIVPIKYKSARSHKSSLTPVIVFLDLKAETSDVEGAVTHLNWVIVCSKVIALSLIKNKR